MGRCSCSGSTCGCKINAGSGATRTGIGTADDPYIISFDSTSIAIGARLALDDSTTIELSQVGDGDGSVGNPFTIKADVVLVSPNGTRYRPVVSNAGTISAVAIA